MSKLAMTLLLQLCPSLAQEIFTETLGGLQSFVLHLGTVDNLHLNCRLEIMLCMPGRLKAGCHGS